jgi:alginate O-acetyltransferase complex protein AlgI
MLPKACRVGVTFVLVLIAWVFFRAETLNGALIYLGSMFGLEDVPKTSLLLDGLLYSRYYLLSMAIAALVVWKAQQTWDWTRDMGIAKVAAVVMLLIVSVAVLSMQSYNPFIYFNF